MNEQDCVIYKGNFFQIEWYYSEKGESQPYDYYKACEVVQQRKFLMLCQRMGDFGKILDTTKFRSEGDDIYAFKPQPDRYLCFFRKGKKIIVTNAYTKKGDKLPKSEKQLAINCKTDYLSRFQNDQEEKK